MKRVMTGTVAVAGRRRGRGVDCPQPAGRQWHVDPCCRPAARLIARGYTEAPAGTAMIANDPNGGSVLKELRIKEEDRPSSATRSSP